MDSRQRIALIVAAAVVAVVAFVVLKPSDDEDSSGDRPSTTAPAPSGGPSGTTGAKPPESKPAVTTIEVKGGRPAGGIEKLEVDRGDEVRFRVESDEEHEIHLHGYDVSKDVAPGRPAVYDFKAEDDGIFEVEVEDTKTQIAELTVNP